MWEKMPSMGSSSRGSTRPAAVAWCSTVVLRWPQRPQMTSPPGDPVDPGADLGHRPDLLIAPALDRVAVAGPGRSSVKSRRAVSQCLLSWGWEPR
jgi:hypothetical protein